MDKILKQWRQKSAELMKEKVSNNQPKIYLNRIVEFCQYPPQNITIEELLVDTKRNFYYMRNPSSKNCKDNDYVYSFGDFIDLYIHNTDYEETKLRKSYNNEINSSSQDITPSQILHNVGQMIKQLLGGTALRYCDNKMPEQLIEETRNRMDKFSIPHSKENDERFAFLCRLFPEDFAKINNVALTKYLVFEYEEDKDLCGAVNQLISFYHKYKFSNEHLNLIGNQERAKINSSIIDKIPMESQHYILNKEILTELQKMMKDRLVELLKQHPMKWDVIFFILMRHNILDATTTRPTAAKIFTALCPELGEPKKLAKSMSRYPVPIFKYINKFDNLSKDNQLRLDTLKYEEILTKENGNDKGLKIW